MPSFLLQAIGMALVPLTGTFEGLLIAASVIGLGNGLGSGTMHDIGAPTWHQQIPGAIPRGVALDRRWG